MQDIDKISLNFILSTGRTGSTLLSSMLNMHPNVISTSEEPFAYNLYPKYHSITNWDDNTILEFCNDFFLFSEGKLEPQFGNKEDLAKILKSHQLHLNGNRAIKLAFFAFFPNKNKENITTIVDKELVFHHVMEKVASYYPSSKFIILYRDPRDNVLIKLKRAKKQNKKTSLLILSKTWNDQYKTILKKISALSSNRYLHVRYEDLVQNPKIELTKICDFLNIGYSDLMMTYDEKFKSDLTEKKIQISESAKSHLSIIHEGLIQKVNTDKIGIWKKELNPEESNFIWSICGETAEKIGYNSDESKKLSYFKLSLLKDLIFFNVKKINGPQLYHGLPYKLRYLIKK